MYCSGGLHNKRSKYKLLQHSSKQAASGKWQASGKESASSKWLSYRTAARKQQTASGKQQVAEWCWWKRMQPKLSLNSQSLSRVFNILSSQQCNGWKACFVNNANKSQCSLELFSLKVFIIFSAVFFFFRSARTSWNTFVRSFVRPSARKKNLNHL